MTPTAWDRLLCSSVHWGEWEQVASAQKLARGTSPAAILQQGSACGTGSCVYLSEQDAQRHPHGWRRHRWLLRAWHQDGAGGGGALCGRGGAGGGQQLHERVPQVGHLHGLAHHRT